MEIEDLPKDKKIILFDGVCNLCNTLVQFVIKRDKKDVFRFVSLQSELGQKIINHIGISDLNVDTMVLYQHEKGYHIKAGAAIRVIIALGGFYRLAKVALLLPKFIPTYIYNYIAKNRYKWYGKKEACMIPTPNITAKFLP